MIRPSVLKRQRKPVNLSPQLERRRALRRDKRRALSIQIWRCLVLLSTTTVLGWSLLRFGWNLEGSDAIVIRGDVGLDPALVAKIGGFQFPHPLLDISPHALEQRLLQDLPVQSVRIERRVFPARLELDLKARIPIAAAIQRRGAQTTQGLVDAQANWIDLHADIPQRQPTSSVLVDGWSETRRPFIAELLGQKDRLGSDLQRIVLEPDGQALLQTSRLGTIRLGADPALLQQQINAIQQLNQSIPSHLLRGRQGSIDLSNPEKPEILQPNKQPKSKKAGLPN
ncbi:MAG: cell division protein FtsQ/DivIB [Synechococcus sp.]